MNEVYTLQEAAKLLKVHEMTLRRMLKEGRLKYVRAGAGEGKKILIPGWALNEFLGKKD